MNTFSEKADRLCATFGKVVCLVAVMCAVIAATPLQRSEEKFGVVVVATSSTTATYANNPTTLPATVRTYNEVCIKHESSDSSKKVWISSFSTVNESLYGWSEVGGEKECHDWTQNVPIYIWHSDGEDSKDVRLLLVR